MFSNGSATLVGPFSCTRVTLHPGGTHRQALPRDTITSALPYLACALFAKPHRFTRIRLAARNAQASGQALVSPTLVLFFLRRLRLSLRL
ncbi:hypothetical protein LCGC14_2904300, partial [marine sediment metagenome]